MKNVYSLLLAVATIASAAPAPYQPSGCKYNLVAGASPCGKKGTLKKPDSLGPAKTVPTFNGCVDYCYSSSSCQSFNYVVSSKACQLYGETLAQQGFTAGKTGPLYYNRNCYTQQCSCGNTGLTYGLFEDHTTDSSTQQNYIATWDPVAVTGSGADYIGGSTVDTLGYQGEGPAQNVSIYGVNYQPANGTNSFAVSHTFYLLPQITGQYSILVYNVDDIVDVWIGSNAYSGWTRSNAIYEQVLATPPSGPVFNATAGVYLPIRMVHGQGLGPWAFRAHMVDPQNQDILDYSGSFPLIHQFSCDKTTAPPFPAFN